MNGCCSAFRRHFEEAGCRGLSVFAVVEAEDPPVFILQFRATLSVAQLSGDCEVGYSTPDINWYSRIMWF